MTKSVTPAVVFDNDCQKMAFTATASRCLLVGAVLALAACSSTPLPPWPAVGAASENSPGQKPVATVPVVAPAAAETSITPVTPSTALQPLPYSAAIAELFPEPQERYSTPGLADNRIPFTRNDELAEVLKQLAMASREPDGQRLGLLEAGSSQQGQPLWAVIATKAPTITPVALDETQKPTVMVVAGQRGDAPASTEAVIVLTQELGAGGLLAPLLDRINIILVPRANPDGFDTGSPVTADGTDLRFDHLQLHTPEARFLAKLVRDYRVSALLDASEFDAIEPTLQQLDAVRANDVGLQYAITPNSHEFVNKAAREWLHHPIGEALSGADLRVDWVAEPAGSHGDDGFAMETLNPTTLGNVSSLKNVPSVEVQSRGADLEHVHAQRRVHSQVLSMTTALQSIASRSDDLRKVQSFVARDVASQGCHKNVTIQARPRKEQRNFDVVDRGRAEIVTKPVVWWSSLTQVEPRSRAHACGYWLSADAATAAERLSMLGINVQRVAELAPLEVETYQPVSSAVASSESLNVTMHRNTIEAQPGSYYVSMNQPLAYLATAALEPDSPYSYVHANLLHLGDVARVTVSPNIVFEDE